MPRDRMNFELVVLMDVCWGKTVAWLETLLEMEQEFVLSIPGRAQSI